MKIVPSSYNPPRYQAIFLMLNDAIKDAIEQSQNLHKRLFIIRAHRLYFVDADGITRDAETLDSIYEDGVELLKESPVVTF